MIVLQLTALAKARIWFHAATPGFIASGTFSRKVDGVPTSVVRAQHLTLEAYVPRGGRTECGLLGIHFDHNRSNLLEIEVPYAEGEGDPWLDSFGARVDDVRLGLPKEYATAISDTTVEFSTGRFPPGKIKIVEAAHGLAGSSVEFFRRIATGALNLMLDDRQRGEKELTEFLHRLLVSREIQQR